eukprot:TRINITY_DN2551_c0_g1_i1.p1 TRINITY_DN2551_c0_g1~~TRINITY_DN2551_c0_g1_i1.p1  ORF type:complete len:225 (-),score=-8.20 TRINITY_DN2551_c0_g1_i1:176-850(-)
MLLNNKFFSLTLRCGLVCPLNLYAFTPKVWPLLNSDHEILLKQLKSHCNIKLKMLQSNVSDQISKYYFPFKILVLITKIILIIQKLQSRNTFEITKPIILMIKLLFLFKNFPQSKDSSCKDLFQFLKIIFKLRAYLFLEYFAYQVRLKTSVSTRGDLNWYGQSSRSRGSWFKVVGLLFTTNLYTIKSSTSTRRAKVSQISKRSLEKTEQQKQCQFHCQDVVLFA